jgi:hypothetical protein
MTKGEQGIELGLLVSGRRTGSGRVGGVDEIFKTKTSTSSCKKVGYALIALVGVFLVRHWNVSPTTSSKPLYVHDKSTDIQDGVGLGEEMHDSVLTDDVNESIGDDETKSSTPAWSPAFMAKALATARADLEAKMRLNYGKFYDTIFFPHGISVGRTIMMPGGCGRIPTHLSTDRFQRKLLIKLLQVQAFSQSTITNSRVDSDQRFPVSFVWATGGDASAAGTGNLFSESYSAVLEQAARDVFAAVGIKFVVRNYAMGYSTSGPEIALCAKEIFGKDIDLLLWDYGMTDGSENWKQELYHWRAAILQETKPVHIVYDSGAYESSCSDKYPIYSRADIIRNMQNLGFASFMSDKRVIDKIMANIPDSAGFLSEAELQALTGAPYVRNFRCGAKSMEQGYPNCSEEKFSHSCMSSANPASWHPGWKSHALKGYTMTLFIIEMLNDALIELLARSDEDPATLLSQLLSEENVDYASFERAEVPSIFQKLLPPSGQDGFDMDLLIKRHNFCHTARAPSEIRFKGIIAETNQTGAYPSDRSIEMDQAKITDSSSDLMRLAYTDGNWHEICSLETILDYKDYFYADRREGWKKLVVPNNAALQEYGNSQPLQGLVLICFATCDYFKCDSGDVGRKKNFPAAFEIQINGGAVTDLWPIRASECSIARNEQEGYKWTPNADGRFEVQFRVKDTNDPGSFLQVSSIIVY